MEVVEVEVVEVCQKIKAGIVNNAQSGVLRWMRLQLIGGDGWGQTWRWGGR